MIVNSSDFVIIQKNTIKIATFFVSSGTWTRFCKQSTRERVASGLFSVQRGGSAATLFHSKFPQPAFLLPPATLCEAMRAGIVL